MAAAGRPAALHQSRDFGWAYYLILGLEFSLRAHTYSDKIRDLSPIQCLGRTASPGIVRDPSLQALRHHVARLAELDNEPRQPEDERRHRDAEHAEGELLPRCSRAGGVEEVAGSDERRAVQDVLQDGQLPQALRGAFGEEQI